MKNQSLEQLMANLQAIITRGGLELLTRYPKDLLVHDRETFGRFWAPKQRFAWMVGHSHSHLVVLGIHPEDNKAVDYYLKLSSEDRFFEITVGADANSFTVTEVDCAGFSAMKGVAIPFARLGEPTSFAVQRAGVKVGHVEIRVTGPYQSRVYQASLSPVPAASLTCQSALHVYADYACRELAGSLFYRSEFHVNDPQSERELVAA